MQTKNLLFGLVFAMLMLGIFANGVSAKKTSYTCREAAKMDYQSLLYSIRSVREGAFETCLIKYGSCSDERSSCNSGCSSIIPRYDSGTLLSTFFLIGSPEYKSCKDGCKYEFESCRIQERYETEASKSERDKQHRVCNKNANIEFKADTKSARQDYIDWIKNCA